MPRCYGDGDTCRPVRPERGRQESERCASWREYQVKMNRRGPFGRRKETRFEGAADVYIGLFWLHGPAVHSYLGRRAGHQEADDLLEEVWLRAFRSRDRSDERLPAQAWL
jgi:Sigma-70 region 2